MSKRRSKSSSGSISAIVVLVFLLLILSKCNKKISVTDRQATKSINHTEFIVRDTQHWETYHAHATSVQKTVDMNRIIATVTAIYKRTIEPTLEYEATLEKFINEIRQQQTVEAYLTEISKP